MSVNNSRPMPNVALGVQHTVPHEEEVTLTGRRLAFIAAFNHPAARYQFVKYFHNVWYMGWTSTPVVHPGTSRRGEKGFMRHPHAGVSSMKTEN